jgi:threonine synthase
MKYISTRGRADNLEFGEVVLAGLARDGGLFLPETYPDFSSSFDSWSKLNYQQLAVEVMLPFVEPTLNREQLKSLVNKSYTTFSDEEITPMVRFSGGYILQLFHGPTFAFKDVALQFLGNLFEELLSRDGTNLNIVGATSGDTGSAAIYGVRGKKGIRIFMLHPEGKVSRVQQLQMTTVMDDNVFNLAVGGNFDDCQQIVKDLFNDLEFRDAYQLGAVNSINFARILAQTVYYFYAGLKFKQLHPEEDLVFSVPTGNFGDVFAGYMAKKMGLPIKQLIIGTNENDIINRVLHSGEYCLKEVKQTLSPAMDIQVSSNFERLLFDLCNKDANKVNAYMQSLTETGSFTLSKSELERFQSEFTALKVDENDTLETIKQQIEQGMTIDPHTAVGVYAASQLTPANAICLSTAHPAKFPEAMELISDVPMNTPEEILKLEGLPQRCESIAANKSEIKEYIVNKCKSS